MLVTDVSVMGLDLSAEMAQSGKRPPATVRNSEEVTVWDPAAD